MNLFKNKKPKKPKKDSQEKESKDEKKVSLVTSLETNLDKIKKEFSFPENNSLKIRILQVPFTEKTMAVLHVEGTVDKNIISEHIIDPLISTKEISDKSEKLVDTIISSILNTVEANSVKTIQDICKHLVNGSTVLLLGGEKSAISVETVGFESRSVTEPTTETVVKGPKAAFIESAAINRSLIRKELRTPQLMCEFLTIGKQSPQQVSVLYMKDICDPTLVEKVKSRISEVQTDTVYSLSVLEQHMEERPYSLMPSLLMTERPDRAAAFIMEGHIVILMENSPGALVTPITFWSLYHTVEDQYLRTLNGNFIRLIRLISIFVALLTPAFYIAVTNFHVEMLPTDLMLAIAATRERIPFPVIWEILFMEIIFEILREAGIRIPTALGPTIGIVGALILGQAAVDANIVSPILVIVVALTGLASFAIPDISLNIAVRILRFGLLVVANFAGLFGIALVAVYIIAYLSSLKSFGVPFFAPIAPHMPSSKDTFFRPPVWKQWLRPSYVSPGKKQRSNKPKNEV